MGVAGAVVGVAGAVVGVAGPVVGVVAGPGAGALLGWSGLVGVPEGAGVAVGVGAVVAGAGLQMPVRII